MIEFARRSEAELAKARGSYEGNVVLSIAWNEEKEIGGKSDPGVVDAEGAGEGTMDQTEG